MNPAFYLELPCPKTKPQIQYSTMTVPAMMPASLRMATLLPDWAMRVRRVALPLSEAEKEEKVSFCGVRRVSPQSRFVVYTPLPPPLSAGWRERVRGKWCRGGGGDCGKLQAYRVVQHPLVARVVVNVDRHAAQGRDFGGQLVQARVVLPVARARVLASGSHSLQALHIFALCRMCVCDWRRRRGRWAALGNEAPMRCATMRRYAPHQPKRDCSGCVWEGAKLWDVAARCGAGWSGAKGAARRTFRARRLPTWLLRECRSFASGVGRAEVAAAARAGVWAVVGFAGVGLRRRGI